MSYSILSFRACLRSNCVSKLVGANISAPAITQDKTQNRKPPLENYAATIEIPFRFLLKYTWKMIVVFCFLSKTTARKLGSTNLGRPEGGLTIFDLA